MKTKLIICCGLLAASLSLKAQTPSINTGMGFGMNLVQYQKDFGMGINLTSPLFANKGMGVRLRGNMMYHEHVMDSTTTWSPYGNLSLGMVGIAGHISDRIRLYGEGGVIAVFPSSNFSSQSLNIGGYGTFGFEFFFYHAGNYFIELGGVGTGAKADKIATKPIYSNGFSISTGFRFYLK